MKQKFVVSMSVTVSTGPDHRKWSKKELRQYIKSVLEGDSAVVKATVRDVDAD